MIRAIIFDCFGVVISDALEVIVRPLRESNPAAADQIRDLVHASSRGMITSREASEQVAAILGISYDAYRQQIVDGEIKDVELLEYIQMLRADYKVAMLSNIGAGGLVRRFEPGELDKSFDAVIVSGEIGYAKPEAQAYEIAADRLGVRLDECLFTDDREGYCEAARGVGMQTILYQDFTQFKRELKMLLTNPQ